MKATDLKTVDIQTLEWFDKVNGNSYFASLITLNFGMDNEVELKNQFQYGYGSAHEFEAWRTIFEYLGLDKKSFTRSFVRDNNIITRTSKKKALKRELKNI